MIVLEGFGFTYDDAPEPALTGIDLVIERGEAVGIIGLNGAGKSTLAMCLNGVVPNLLPGAVSGSIRVAGMDPTSTPVREMARMVGLVLDDPGAQMSQLTVAEEVAFGLENLGVGPLEMGARIDSVLGAVGLAGLDERSPLELSGGQQQRLIIASVLAMRTGVLVLDEPTSNLDPAGRDDLLEIVRQRRRHDGLTVVIVEHDIDALAASVERIVVLDTGRIVLDGPVRDILGRVDVLAGLGLRPPAVTEVVAALAGPGSARLPVTLAEAVDWFSGGPETAGQTPAPAPSRSAVVAPGASSATVSGASAAAVSGASAVVVPFVTSAAVSGTSTAEVPVIRLDHVRFVYPATGVVAVDDLSVAIGAGESVAVIGRNGAGKSTFARLLDGLLRPTSGTVAIAGRDIRDVPVRRLAAEVGYVFQQPSHQLFARTVAEELAFGPRNLGLSAAQVAERVTDAADAFDLTELLSVHPYRLSGATRKMVAMAAVCAMRPRVLVLDEPTTGQDHRTAERIGEHVRRLVARGDTVISLTHDLRFVAEVATRVVVLDAGRLAADGPARVILGDASVMDAAGLRRLDVSVLSSRLPGHSGRPVALTPAELIGELRDGVSIADDTLRAADPS